MNRRRKKNKSKNLYPVLRDTTPVPPSPKSDSSTTIARIEASSVSFSGPLPPPDMLQRYNEIIPNGADRVMTMAENQSKHRERIEAAVIESNVKSQARGTTYGFIMGMTGLLGGMFLIYSGHGTTGITAFLSSIGALASVFFIGRKHGDRELSQKSSALESRRKR